MPAPGADGVQLSGPDRSVPLPCRIQFLFGGIRNQLNWSMFASSSILLHVFWASPKRPVLIAFTLSSLGLIAFGMLKGLRGLRLLRRGMTAEGRLIDLKEPDPGSEGERVWEISYEFTTSTGRKAVAKARNIETDALTDQPLEPLVYDPLDPSNAVMLDDLPGRPRLDRDSVTRTDAEGRELMYLLLPAATVLLHVGLELFKRR